MMTPAPGASRPAGADPAGKVRGPMRFPLPVVILLDRRGGAVYSGRTARDVTRGD
jgi:hypothetical protein